MNATSVFTCAFLFFSFFVLANVSASQAANKTKEAEINVIVTFNVKKENVSEFSKIVSNVKKELPKVAGCNSVKIYNDINAPLIFTFIENWSSKELHKAHVSSLIESGSWADILEHLQKKPTSSYYLEL